MNECGLGMTEFVLCIVLLAVYGGVDTAGLLTVLRKCTAVFNTNTLCQKYWQNYCHLTQLRISNIFAKFLLFYCDLYCNFCTNEY